MGVVEVALDQDLQRRTKIGAELKEPWTDTNGFGSPDVLTVGT